MKRAHVFLSHNTADKSYVEALAHRLQDAGIEPWLDKWNLQDALRQSYSGLAAVLRRSGKEKEAQDASQKAQALSKGWPRSRECSATPNPSAHTSKPPPTRSSR